MRVSIYREACVGPRAAHHVFKYSRTVRCRCQSACTASDVLERFWRARGVSNETHLAKLVECGIEAPEDATAWDPNEPLPGVNTFWQLDRNADCVDSIHAVSSRLLGLHSLLGGRSDVNVAEMLIKEPRLLTAELPDIASRLVMMRTTEGAQSLDIGKIVETQPSLLLHDGSSSQDSPEAWSFGLASNDEQQWSTFIEQLAAYRSIHGDSHVGFRAGEDQALVKCAKMHRSGFRDGTLPQDRIEALEALGFSFDAEEAEWQVMFRKLVASQGKTETAAHMPALPAADDFLLTNWCSVQRIANRSGVLSEPRKELLDSVEFDWTGADALS